MVGLAVGVLAGTVVVVSVHIVVEVCERAVGVCDGGQRGRGVLHKATGGAVVRAGQQDPLGGRAGVTDGRNDLLQGLRPGVHVETIRLIHDTENDVGRRGILGGKLSPQTCELRIGWTPVELCKQLILTCSSDRYLQLTLDQLYRYSSSERSCVRRRCNARRS